MLTVFGRGKSSKLLAHALGVKRNVLSADGFIRWKTAEPFPNKKAYEINSRKAVMNSSNKFASLMIMQDALINTPPVLTSAIDVEKDINAHPDHIWFGRRYYHTQGKDITIYRKNDVQTKVATNHDYFIRYLKPKSEYRYHVAFDKVILPTKKILADGRKDDSLIRNHQGGKWQQVVCKPTERFASVCIAAVKAHGLHFGAVDFLNINGEAVILEINTAPGLQVDNRLEAYVKAIESYLANSSK